MVYRIYCFFDTEVEADNEDEALEYAMEWAMEEIGIEPCDEE